MSYLSLLSISLSLLPLLGMLPAHGSPAPIKAPAPRSVTSEGIVTIDTGAAAESRQFHPYSALGAGLDGQEKGDVDPTFTSENIKAMRSAGFKPLSYRLRTELGMEAWHWNPKGTWSDPVHEQGYWTSDSHPGLPISICNGFRLPRRGNTGDQANNTGYSRLDDGDLTTFWKSNPYLDPHFTGQDHAQHPQWVVVDLGSPQRVNSIRISWAIPYATQYQVQYWEGKNEDGYTDEGQWKVFPGGSIPNGKGSEDSIRLSRSAIPVQYVKLLMTASSEVGPLQSKDIRDRLGYAIREIAFGLTDSQGRFHDSIHHARSSAHQTLVYTSSTDPWHRATDRDENVEQPGFDRVFRSGLTNGAPMLVPAGALYDTPDNAAAELRYLEARGYPVAGFEIGEEPDGQYVTPEDFAELYRQCSLALHRIEPALKTGGPSFQNADVDVIDWPERTPRLTWLGRMALYLHTHGQKDEPGFISFEWYPFENPCDPPAAHLAEEPDALAKTVNRLRNCGINPTTPLYITEYGYSAYGAEEEDDLAGAIFNAEVASQFLQLGGTTSYLYGCEPNTLIHEKDCEPEDMAWGQNMLFLADDQHHIRFPMPTYYGAQLLNNEWLEPGNGVHTLFNAHSNIRNSRGRSLVTAYAVHRPDGTWSILLLNKDPQHTWPVTVQFHAGQGALPFAGPIEVYQYSPLQYQWHAAGEHGCPSRDLPPTHRTLPPGTKLPLPPFSITVMRGRVEE